jgi:hypothetical protein
MTEVAVIEGVAVEPAPVDPVVEFYPGGYALVTVGVWAVSISPDALIRLPQGVPPETVPDLVAALNAAADVALRMRADAEAAEVRRPPATSVAGTLVKEGPPEPGYVRFPIVPTPRPAD